MRAQSKQAVATASRWYASRAHTGPLSYFLVLGVQQSASTEEVKQAFREVNAVLLCTHSLHICTGILAEAH